MITYRKPGLLGASFVLLFLAAAAPHAPLGVDFPGEAQAIVGRPLTPVSVAGVARRTAVRTTAVVATTTTASAASARSMSASTIQTSSESWSRTPCAAIDSAPRD